MRYLDCLYEAGDIVTSVHKENDFLLVGTQDTIFYPGGGGQPCDVGTMTSEEFEGVVIEVIKEKGILHRVKPIKGTLSTGDKVTLVIDRERRDALVRMHTGEHILFKSIEMVAEDADLVKIKLGIQESSIFLQAKHIDWNMLLEAERTANRIIQEDRPIIEKEYTKEEAVALGKLRMSDRIDEHTVRVVEIQDFDWSACAGTHAPSTGFVKSIFITHFSITKGDWEIRFKTDAIPAILGKAGIARRAADMLHTDDLLSSIEHLQEESETYKQRFRDISYRLLDVYKKETIGDIKFIHSVVEGIEKKQLIDKSNELVSDNTVVCFINEIEDKTLILLNSDKGDMPGLLKTLYETFPGKGGGRGTFAMGSIEGDPHEILQSVRSILSSDILSS